VRWGRRARNGKGIGVMEKEERGLKGETNCGAKDEVWFEGEW
jgi:hypothetical protein